MAAVVALLVSSQPATAQPAVTIPDARQLADWWIGRYDNRAQITANTALGQPDVPELTRTARTLTIERIAAPQLGDTVVLLQEYKAPDMTLANRSRVYVLRDQPDGRVRAVQHFFFSGPTYDRKPVDAAAVRLMKPADFTLSPGCDLYFGFDAATERWGGGMSPRTCVYEHAVDGFVYAEFDQFIGPRETWYRDRSVKVATATERGSIDGFTYLRFVKLQ